MNFPFVLNSLQAIVPTMRFLPTLILTLATALVPMQSWAQSNALVRFEADRVSVREGESAVTLGIRVLTDLSTPLVMGIQSTAIDGADSAKLSALQSQVIIRPGQETADISFLISDDANLTGDQSFAVELYPIDLGDNEGILVEGPALIKVIDDEAYSPARLEDLIVAESAGRIALPIQLDRPAETRATATLEIFPDTARAGQDYLGLQGDVVFEPGQQSAVFEFDILDDALFEADETLVVRFVRSEALEVLDFEAIVTIEDNDVPPTLRLFPTQATEGAGSGSIAIGLTSPAGVLTSVDFDFVSETAELGTDFSGTGGTLSFPEGVTQQLVPYQLVDDARDELNEQFSLVFSNAKGISLGEESLSVVVIDDDLPPTLIVETQAVAEGKVSIQTLALDAPSDREIRITYQLTGQTATLGQDIEARQETLTFTPGETGPLEIELSPIDDDLYEQVEQIGIQITDALNAQVIEQTYPIDLIDNESLPILSLLGFETIEGSPTGHLRFGLSGPSSRISAFSLETKSVQAIAGQDYSPISDTFGFPAGETEILIPLRLINDDENEIEEEMKILVANPEGLALADPVYSVSITDDDPEPIIVLTGQRDLSENQTEPLVIGLALSQRSGRDIVLSYGISSEGSDPRADFEQFGGMLTIPAGQTGAVLRLFPIDDDIFENEELVLLTIDQAEGASLPREAFPITIQDDDLPPVATLLVPTLQEGSPGRAIIELSKPAGIATPFRLGFFEGTAREGFDYAQGETEVEIPVGAQSLIIDLPILDDDIFEGPESFDIAILDFDHVSLPNNLIEAIIEDDDSFPQLSLVDTLVSEGDGQKGLIDVQLSTAADETVRLSYEILSGTALAGKDFLTTSGVLEFAPGQTVRQIDAQIVNDRIFEGLQTFSIRTLALEGAEFSEGVESWNIELIDNDPLPRLLITETQILESDTESLGRLLFGLDRRSELPVSFDYQLADGENAAGDLILPAGTIEFAAEQVQATLEFAPVQDNLDEATETFHLLFKNGSNLRLPRVAARIQVIDDDPLPEISIEDAIAIESIAGDQSFIDFVLRLSEPSGRPIQASVASEADQNAVSAADPERDIAPLAETVRFEPGETEKSVRVLVQNDEIDEDFETFAVRLTDVDLANPKDVLAIGTIEDEDDFPVLRADSLSVSEAAESTQAVRLNLSQESGKLISVDYRLVPENADLGSDIRALQGTLLFLPGQVSQELPLTLINDSIDESIETLKLELTNAIGADLDPGNPATITITDDDLGPRLTVQVLSLTEGSPSSQSLIRLNLAEPSAQSLNLDWQAIPGSAQAETDFILESGTIEFAPGETQQTIPISIIDDQIDEAEETIELLLSSNQIRIETPTNEIRILDNDAAPDLELVQTTLLESGSISSVTLSLSQPAERDLKGHLIVEPETATQGVDFTFPSLEFTIPAGATRIPLSVNIADDQTDEPNERFVLRANLDVADAGAGSEAKIWIEDDDPVPDLTLGDAIVTEGQENASIGLSISEPSGKSITLAYNFIGGSAVEGEEFINQPRTISIPPGTSEISLPLFILDDETDEIDENFSVQIVDVSQAAIGRGMGTITVQDNDDPVFVRIEATEVMENQRAEVQLRLDQPSGQTIELEVETVSGVAVAGEDYVSRNGRIIFEPGQQTAVFSIDLLDDGYEEEPEEFSVQINSSRNAQYLSEPAKILILDNDVPASLSVRSVDLVESRGGRGGSIIFELATESEEVVVVEYDFSDGTAENNVDYALQPGALIFLPGETMKSISVPLQADGKDEFDETFILNILAANVPVPQNQIPFTIIDSDAPPSLTLDFGQTSEDAGRLDIVARLSDSTEKSVQAKFFLTTDQSAFLPAIQPQEIVFEIQPGQTSQRISLDISDDDIDEFDEVLALTLVDVRNANSTRDTFGGLIIDNDEPPMLQFQARQLREDFAGNTNLQIVLNQQSGKPITFDYSFVENTAVAGEDWRADAGQLRIEPGVREASIPIQILDDSIYEGNETLLANLRNLVNATTRQGRIQVEILENERPPSLIGQGVTVQEGARAELNLQLDNASALPLELSIELVDQTAAVGRDIEAISRKIVFAPGEQQKTISLRTIDDPFDEEAEYAELRFSADLIQIPDGPLVIEVVDNDAPPTLQIAISQSQEGMPSLVSASLDAASNKTISFRLVPTDGTAQLNDDYIFAPTQVVFEPGQTTLEFPIELIGDGLDEQLESFEIGVEENINIQLPAEPLLVSIVDLDPVPELLISDLILDESDAGTSQVVLVELSARSGQEVSLTLASADASAQAGLDYDPVLQTITFAPGEVQKSVPIQILDDALFETAESFLLTLGQIENASVSNTDILISILDDDVKPTLSYSNVSLFESSRNERFAIPLRLSSPAGQQVDFEFRVSTDLGDLASDIIFDDLSVSFLPGQMLANLEGVLVGDLIDEVEQIVVLLPLISGEIDAPDSGLEIRIEDDDPAPSVFMESGSLVEGSAQELNVRVFLDMPSEKRISVDLRTQDATATSGSDYLPADLTLVFGPGQTEQFAQVALQDDDIFEPNERFNLELSNAQNASIAVTIAQIELVDNDSQPLLVLDTVRVEEGQEAQVRVTMTRASSQQVRATFRLADATGLVGRDIVVDDTSLVFEPGELEKFITVRAIQDTIDELDESVSARLTNIENAVASNEPSEILIVDQNDQPTFDVLVPSVDENIDASAIVFTIRLTNPSSQALTLEYTTMEGTALAGQDFVQTSGQILFDPGQVERSVRVELIDDAQFEGDETFFLNLNVLGDTAAPIQSEARIVDNDSPPTLLIEDVVAVEGDDVLAVFVSLSAAANTQIDVDFETLDLSAAAGSDYKSQSGQVSFLPGALSEILFFELLDDQLNESQEVFQIEFKSDQVSNTAQILANVEILDNDPLPLLEFETLAIQESNAETFDGFLVGLDAASDQMIRFDFEVVLDGEATADDVRESTGTIEIMPGETSALVPVEIFGDGIAEGTETFSLVFTSIQNARIINPRAVIEIVENSAPSLALNSPAATEGEDLIFAATLSPVSARPLFILYGEVDSAGNFLGEPSRATFAPLQSSIELALPTQDNAIDEVDRTASLGVKVASDSPLNLTRDEIFASGKILDDEPDPILSISASLLKEGSQGNLTFSLNGRTNKVANVLVSLGSAQSAQPGLDIAPLNLSFNLQDLTQPLEVPLSIIDDDLNENTEAFELIVTAQGVEIMIDESSLLIADNDPLPILDATQLSVTEGSSQVPQLVLSQPSGRDLEVELFFLGQNAAQGDDFEVLSTFVSIPAGQTVTDLPIEIINNDRFELAEKFSFDILQADFVSLPLQSFEIEILDDDQVPNLRAEISAGEENSKANLSLILSAISDVSAFANVELIGQTATTGVDLDFISQRIEIPAGQRDIQIEIGYLDDGTFEGTETYEIQIDNGVNTAIQTPSLVGEITDNDQPPSLVLQETIFLETDLGKLRIPYQTFGAFEGLLSVPFTLESGTATLDEDFVIQSGVIELRPESSSGEISIELKDDQKAEGFESFFITIDPSASISQRFNRIEIGIIDNEFLTNP